MSTAVSKLKDRPPLETHTTATFTAQTPIHPGTPFRTSHPILPVEDRIKAYRSITDPHTHQLRHSLRLRDRNTSQQRCFRRWYAIIPSHPPRPPNLTNHPGIACDGCEGGDGTPHTWEITRFEYNDDEGNDFPKGTHFSTNPLILFETSVLTILLPRYSAL